MEKKTYTLEKKIDGDWYTEDKYKSYEFVSLLKRCFELGRMDFVQDIRISTYFDPAIGKES